MEPTPAIPTPPTPDTSVTPSVSAAAPTTPATPTPPQTPDTSTTPPLPPSLSATLPTVTTPQGRNNKTLYIVLGVVAGVILLTGGIGYASYQAFQNSPQVTFLRMLGAMAQVRSADVDGSVVAEFTGVPDIAPTAVFMNIVSEGGATPVSGAQTATLTFRNQVNAKDEKNVRNSLSTTFAIAAASGSETLGVDLVTTSDIGYLRFPQIPTNEYINGAAILNKWYSFDINETLKQFSARQDKTPSSWSGKDVNVVRIINSIRTNPILKDISLTKGEVIDGHATKLLSASLDRDNTARLIILLDQELSHEPMSNDEQNDLRATLSHIESSQVQLIINAKTMHLDKAVITTALKDIAGEKNSSARITSTTHFKKINEDISIATPEKADYLENILKELFAPTSSAYPALDMKSVDDTEIIPEGIEPTIDTDGDTLLDLEEAAYGADPSLFDTDGDGFSDGEEVRNGYNPNGAGMLKK